MRVVPAAAPDVATWAVAPVPFVPAVALGVLTGVPAVFSTPAAAPPVGDDRGLLKLPALVDTF